MRFAIDPVTVVLSCITELVSFVRFEMEPVVAPDPNNHRKVRFVRLVMSPEIVLELELSSRYVNPVRFVIEPESVFVP